MLTIANLLKLMQTGSYMYKLMKTYLNWCNIFYKSIENVQLLLNWDLEWATIVLPYVLIEVQAKKSEVKLAENLRV